MIEGGCNVITECPPKNYPSPRKDRKYDGFTA